MGGTDAAAILGVSRFANAHDVWLEKRGEAPARRETAAMEWGTALESVIADKYAGMLTDGILENPHNSVFRMRAHPELIGTPDRLVTVPAGIVRGVEIKTASAFAAHEWGAEGTEYVPPAYLVQCAHYMAVLGVDEWDLVVLIGGSDYRVHRLHRNADRERIMVAALTRWWQAHVIEGKEPPIGDSDLTRAWLGERFPRETRPTSEATPEMVRHVVALRDARGRLERAEADKATAENNLKALIGDSAGADGADFRLSWKATRPARIVDWYAVAMELARQLVSTRCDGEPPADLLAAVAEPFTAERPGARRFLFTERRGTKA